MYTVIDFYENPFGEAVYVTKSREDAKNFCKEYTEQTNGKCKLKIKKELDADQNCCAHAITKLSSITKY